MHRTTRREFVKRTATVIAAPMIIPASALGFQDRPSPSGRITLGFIGVGKMNYQWLRRFLTYKDVQVLAVCEVDKTRRENAKNTVEKAYSTDTKYKGCDAYVDFNELIARSDIDAVVIATPDHWHMIPAIEAVKSGKDVYCEKPLTLTIHESELIIKAVRKYKRVFQTGSQQRSEFRGRFRKACEFVRSGRIGRVLSVNVGVGIAPKWCDLAAEDMEPGLDWDRWLGPAPKRDYHSILSPRGIHRHFPAWRAYREYSGGYLADMGAHHFDIAQWGLDMDESGPVEVHPPEDPKMNKGVKLIYANGVEVIHGGPSGVTFMGVDGMISVDRGQLISRPDRIVKQPLGEKEVHLFESPGHHRNWLDCIKSRKRPIADVEIGARSAVVCHLANLAYWHRRKLRWDPKKWEFPGDAEANRWRDRERRDPYQLPKI